MGAEYIVFGRSIPTYKSAHDTGLKNSLHIIGYTAADCHDALALATYAAVATPIVAMKFTGKKEAAVNVIQASSQDEEAFIREFIKAAEEDTKNV
ncbi:hypothetical protein BG006_004441 [Podila minutissima]|uniref:Uncharacterized protein n=1 Tax=Podila minutissima TaxID=64525 RepID=A0A9P5VMP9_9FUNG|nr:hypothetical protein BG006_004441 [Podila minutissima]